MNKIEKVKSIVAAIVSTLGAVACGPVEPAENEVSPEAAFAQRLVGTYERVSPVPAPDGSTAYLRITLTIAASGTPEIVTQGLTTDVFFDEALTEQVINYESVGPCEVLRPSSIPNGFEVDCTNDSSILTVFTTDPGLMQALGFDDCELTAGEPKDVSDGCAAPTFVVSNCVDQDVFALSEDGTEFLWGDQAQDRCVRRTTELEPDAFVRL